MRVVLPENQGVTYIVTAEAEGYVSYPISYTIQLSGTNFYLVENGQATSKQIINLKFQFTLLNSSANFYNAGQSRVAIANWSTRDEANRGPFIG